MIYYVEDDPNIRNLAIYTLEQSGMSARGFSTAKELYAACAKKLPKLVLLDIMLPEEDGISVLKHLRAQAATAKIPIMMITAKSSEFDVVTGLDSGADDYISKPFGMMELVSRANALLRRSQQQPEPTDADGAAQSVEVAGVRLLPSQRVVTVNGREVVLTRKEFDLLYLLMENQGMVFTRGNLLTRIWGWDFGGNTRTVDVHVQTLRKKLGEAASIVDTVHGGGYRIRECQD